MVYHDDHDCEQWLCSKGSLKKEDQHYGECLRAEVDLSSRKTYITVLGFKKRNFKSAQPPTHPHDHQPDVTPAKNSLAIPEQPTAAPPVTEQLVSKKERIDPYQSITNFQEISRVNEASKDSILSHSEVLVPSSIMNSLNSSKEIGRASCRERVFNWV